MRKSDKESPNAVIVRPPGAVGSIGPPPGRQKRRCASGAVFAAHAPSHHFIRHGASRTTFKKDVSQEKPNALRIRSIPLRKTRL